MAKLVKIFKDSAKSVVDELSKFGTPPTNCSVENVRVVNYLPTQVVITQGLVQFTMGS